MGVLTTGVVPAGMVFGPVPANLTLSDPALLIGHMTCDNRPDIHTVKVGCYFICFVEFYILATSKVIS